MFHLFSKVYIEDIDIFKTTNQVDQKTQVLVYCQDKHIITEQYESLADFRANFETTKELWSFLSSNSRKLIIYMDFFSLTKIQIEYWLNILAEPNKENLYWLHETYLKDMRLKSTSASHSIQAVQHIKNYRPIEKQLFYEFVNQANTEIKLQDKIEQIGLEYLLASYLKDRNSPYSQLFFDRINHLSWRQIIQEFFVIRNQLINALFNNINLALPKEHHIDYSIDIEAQMYGNPYLSWMLDNDFREDNPDYIKENYDINTIAELYDNWIKYRRPKDRTPELELELDNLTWITNAIKEENWQYLFEKNLERDFGCIYVDNWLIHKANQVWTGMLYREANHSDNKEICHRLALRE